MSARLDKEIEMKLVYRQGDVGLVKAKKPSKTGKAIARKSIVLALGEVTGHSHVLTGDVTEYQIGNLRMICVESPSFLNHQEHETIKVMPDWYVVEAQVSYTPQAIKRVLD